MIVPDKPSNCCFRYSSDEKQDATELDLKKYLVMVIIDLQLIVI